MSKTDDDEAAAAEGKSQRTAQHASRKSRLEEFIIAYCCQMVRLKMYGDLLQLN